MIVLSLDPLHLVSADHRSSDEELAQCARERAERKARDAALDVEIEEVFRGGAACSAAWILKRCARDYRDRPARLEILYPGLSIAEPRKMIAVGEALLHKEASTRRPPQLVPTILINAKAVILLGRYQRRYAKPLETA